MVMQIEKQRKPYIDELPKDWSIVTLGEVGESLIGLTYSPREVADFGTLVLRSSNIKNNKIVLKDNVYVKNKKINENIKIRENDLLICARNGSRQLIGKCALINKPIENSTFGAFMSVFRSEKNKYIFYFFQTKAIKSQIEANLGATINQITSKDIKSFKISIPNNKKEQQKIATALSDMDDLSESLEKIIDKKKKIKQGTMQQLLTGKKRLPEFEKEWKVVKVDDFGSIITGGTPSTKNKEYWNGDFPWVTPTDIMGRKNILKTDRMITQKGIEVINRLPARTVLVTCIASIGKNAILMQDGACNQQINAILPNNNYNSDFLYYLMENNKSYLMSKAGITATNIISKQVFSEIAFLVPELKEQRAIAEILSDMDTEIESLEEKLEKYKKLKDGMMQELLTGRIRLV